APKADLVQIVQTTQRPLLGILGLVLIIVVALLSLKTLKSGAPENGSPVLALPRADAMPQPALAAGPLVPVQLPTNTMRDKVNSTIEQQPDVAARVVRAWLKEA